MTCHEWPWCTGHAGPTADQRERERQAAAERVAVKRMLRRELAARGLARVTIR